MSIFMSMSSIKTGPSRSDRKRSGIEFLCNEIVRLRKLRGLNQKDLADRIGLKTSAQLCKLEKGKHLPHADFLEKIERSMGLPPLSLVSMRNQIAQDGCYDDNELFDDPYERFVPTFANHTIPVSEIKAMTSAIQPIVEEYAKHLKKLNLPSFCRVNLGTMRTSTAEDGIDYAEGLRSLLGDYTAPLPALLPRLEQFNFRIFPLPTLPPVISDGIASRRNTFCFHDQRQDNPVIVVNGESPPYAQLYDIAYEIGSYLRYRRGLTLRCLRTKDEWPFCRAFAATFLIPTIVIRDIVDELRVPKEKWSLRLVDDIALRFGVSSKAMLYRLQSIRRISDARYKALMGEVDRPNAYKDTSVFTPLPPLAFGTWLKTLRLRTKIERH